MMGTGRVIFRGGKEEVSDGIGRRVVNKKGEGNAPGNDGRLGMRVGVQSGNLTY